MAKFVIAGRSDCPYFAKIELIADKLKFNLKSLSIQKEVIEPDKWGDWVSKTCAEKGFSWGTKSPFVWRELTDRGGRGRLVGGYNEFCEYAVQYYNITVEMASDMLTKIAKENIKTKLKFETEKIAKNNAKKPMKIVVTNPGSQTSYQLLPTLLKDKGIFKSGNDFDGFHLSLISPKCESLDGLVMELEDLATGNLFETDITNDLENAIKDSNLIIFLDDSELLNTETEYQWLLRNREIYLNYAKVLKNLSSTTRVFLSGSFANVGASLFLKNIPNLRPNNILTSGALIENIARSCLSRQLSVNAAQVRGILHFGSTLDQEQFSLVLLKCGKVRDIQSAIVGPNGYCRNLDEILFEKEWQNEKFNDERRDRKTGPLAFSSAIIKALRSWYRIEEEDDGQLISCGVLAQGQYGISETFLCLPGKFTNGNFVVEEVELNENEERQLTDIVEAIKRQHLIVTLEEEDRIKFFEEERAAKKKAEEEARLEEEFRKKREEDAANAAANATNETLESVKEE